VFDAVVGEIPDWWIDRIGERPPEVVRREGSHFVVFRSPVIERPDDTVELAIRPRGAGCDVELTIRAPEAASVADLAVLRHRWGHHLGGELREWLDHGTPVQPSDLVTWCSRAECRPRD
jgi:hypothetical protein